MSPRRPIAVLAVGLGGLLLSWLGPGLGGAAPVAAGLLPTTTTESPTTEPPTTDTPTTEDETPTTVRPTTSRPTPTTRPTPSTFDFEDEDTTTSFDVTTSTEAPTTSTSTPRLLVAGPPVDPETGVEPTTTTSTTVPVEDNQGETARQVTLAVTGLIVLAAVFGGLTVWYWKRTKPRVAPAGTR